MTHAAEDLTALYQETILDHSRNPRNRRAIADPDGHAEGNNPLCGDRVEVYLTRSGDLLDDVSFTGEGCAICTASASMMTQALKGRDLGEAEAVFDGFRRMLAEDAEPAPSLGKLAAFAGVRAYPVRVKCATLPWHAFHHALENKSQTATTE